MQDGGTGRGRRKSARDGGASKNAAPEQRRALYHCNYCSKDISCVARIKCAICPDFDLCLECFAVGAEITPHKNEHDYRVVDNLSFPIFHPEWGADEELLLLEAIDMYGMGNWSAVAEHVGNKSVEQCRQHYMATYINVDSFPLPTGMPEYAHLSAAALRAGSVHERHSDHGQGPRKRARLEAPAASAAATSAAKAPTAQPSAVDGAAPSMVSDGSRVVVVKEEASTAGAAGAAAAAGAAGAGAGAEAKEEDGVHVDVHAAAAQKRQLHAAMEYAAAVAAGQAVAAGEDAKGHVQTSGRTIHADAPAANGNAADAAHTPAAASAAAAATASVSTKQQHHQQQQQQQQAAGDAQGPPAAATPGGTAAAPLPTTTPGSAGAAAPVAGPAWTGPPEYAKPKLGYDPDGSGYHFKRHDFDPEWDNDAECIIADMEFTDADTEEDRRQKLRMLEIYNKRLDERERRRNFIVQHNLVRVKHFQAQERSLAPQERDTLARLRVFARFQTTPGEHEELVEGVLLEQRLRARVQELQEYRRNGVRTLADADAFEADRRRSKAADPNAALGPRAGAGVKQEDMGISGTAASPAMAASAKPGSQSSGPAASRSSALALQSWRTRRGLPLDITCLPGVELLGRRERELCAMARLLPVQYLALKDMMMRDCQKHGAVTRQEARSFFRLDPQRCLKMYDLWASLGWVTTGHKDHKEQRDQRDQRDGKDKDGGHGGRGADRAGAGEVGHRAMAGAATPAPSARGGISAAGTPNTGTPVGTPPPPPMGLLGAAMSPGTAGTPDLSAAMAAAGALAGALSTPSALMGAGGGAAGGTAGGSTPLPLLSPASLALGGLTAQQLQQHVQQLKQLQQLQQFKQAAAANQGVWPFGRPPTPSPPPNLQGPGTSSTPGASPAVPMDWSAGTNNKPGGFGLDLSRYPGATEGFRSVQQQAQQLQQLQQQAGISPQGSGQLQGAALQGLVNAAGAPAGVQTFASWTQQQQQQVQAVLQQQQQQVQAALQQQQQQQQQQQVRAVQQQQQQQQAAAPVGRATDLMAMAQVMFSRSRQPSQQQQPPQQQQQPRQ